MSENQVLDVKTARDKLTKWIYGHFLNIYRGNAESFSASEFIHQPLQGYLAAASLLSSSTNIILLPHGPRILPAAADIAERSLSDVNLLVRNPKLPRGSSYTPGSNPARSRLKRKTQTQLTSYCLHTLLSIMYNIHCIDTK